MESSFAAKYDSTLNKGTLMNARELSANLAAVIAVGGQEKAAQEEEEEEEEGEEEEEQGHALNKEMEEPMCAVAENAPPLGQYEPQQHAQKCAKRSRPSTAKERISKMPPCAAGKRSSIYRGVTRHRWTGRYEAHLWDKSTWNQTQNKKGKQVYLGAYDDEEAAARAYDLAALKYWGPGTLINFPVSDYARDIDEMQSLSREEYLALLRRKSNGVSRVSKMKAGRNYPNARWDAQAGGSFVSTLPVISGYDPIREGGCRPSYEFGVLGCSPAGMINLCHFMNWLQPPTLSGEMLSNVSKKASKYMEDDRSSEEHSSQRSTTCDEEYSDGTIEQEERYRGNELPPQCLEPYQLPSFGLHNRQSKSGMSALSALSRSSMFARMEEGLNATKGPETSDRNRVSESATAALAAALAMDDCVQSQEVETTCSPYQNYFNSVHPSSIVAEATALAAALGMDDHVQLSQEVESTNCLTGQNNSQADVPYTTLQAKVETASCSNDYTSDFAHTHPLLTLPLPSVPYLMDQSVYLSDHMPGLWSTFEPLSSISMGMIFL